MKTKMVCGVFKFNDAEKYSLSDCLKAFSKFSAAEKYADKCWQNEQVYGGYVVKALDRLTGIN